MTAPVALPLRKSTVQGYFVANIKSQVKRNRQNERRHDRNRAVRSEIRTRTKRANEAVAAGADNADELTRQAMQVIDRAAASGVLHKNAAARQKSRLMKQAASAG
jgi:small subunit ribosomal protein S20